MPTNLPPEYFEADKRFREAQSILEKVSCLEELISTVPKHKGTDKLRADLRRQLSKLKSEAKTQKHQTSHHSAYRVQREGAGQAILVGPTNTGKSSLLTTLTNASPEISSAPFTTWKPTVGMMEVNQTQVQLVDTPPLDLEFIEPAMIDLIRRTDLLLVILNIQGNPIEQFDKVIATLKKYRILPEQFKDEAENEERLTILPLLVLVNKCDDSTTDEDYEICCELLERELPTLPISATSRRNLDKLRHLVFDNLDVIRVFTQAPGQNADLEKPFVLRKGSTVSELAGKIHKDFLDNLKSARVWGSSAFDGQKVQRDFVLQDGDIVEFKV